MGKDLARLVRDARIARGWTQTELAKAMGVSRGYIGQLEAGDVGLPRSARLERIEQLLGLDRETMLRAAGRLGVDRDAQVMAELRRISAMPNVDDRIEALKQLPAPWRQAVEDLALDVIRASASALGRK